MGGGVFMMCTISPPRLVYGRSVHTTACSGIFHQIRLWNCDYVCFTVVYEFCSFSRVFNITIMLVSSVMIIGLFCCGHVCCWFLFGTCLRSGIC